MIEIIVASAITSSGLKHLNRARGYSRNLTVSCLRVRKGFCFYLKTILSRLDWRAFGRETHVCKPRIFQNCAKPKRLDGRNKICESVVFRNDASIWQNAAQSRIKSAFRFDADCYRCTANKHDCS